MLGNELRTEQMANALKCSIAEYARWVGHDKQGSSYSCKLSGMDRIGKRFIQYREHRVDSTGADYHHAPDLLWKLTNEA